MKTYEYRGFDKTGHGRSGLVEAISIKQARERLASEGVLAERVSLTGRQARFPVEVRSRIYRELSALLGAGVSMVRALNILLDSPEMTDGHVVLAGVRDRVREGVSLADSLAEAGESVTVFEQAIIEAGERSGTVTDMLERLAGFIEDRHKLRQSVKSALTYPLIVVGVGISVAILMLGLLLPRARDLLAGSSIDMPALTVFMMGFGSAVMKWGLPVLGILAVSLFFLLRRLHQDPEFHRRWDRQMFRVPVFGRGYTTLVNLRFSRTMAILLQGGVSVIDGLLLAGRATGSAWIEELAGREAEAVRHGSSLEDAIRRIPPLSASLPEWIRIGEAGGGLARLLDSASRRSEDHWERFIRRCLSLLEPLLIMAIGGFVLLVTAAILLPVISLTDAVGR